MTAPLPCIALMAKKGGGIEQSRIGDALLRGLGDALEKSTELLLVSRQPPLARRAAVVFDRSGARPLPSKQVAVEP